MRSAPSVSYPVGRSRFGESLLLVVWCIGLTSWLYWLLEGAAAPWSQGATAAVLAGCGMLAWHGARRTRCGRLGWDGERWTWHAEGAQDACPVGLDVACDLQKALLVRVLSPQGGDHWHWLEQRSDAAAWHDLRRALYSSDGRLQPVDAQEGTP